MMILTDAFLWDFLPNAALYYCHFNVTSKTGDLTRQNKEYGEYGIVQKANSPKKVVLGQNIIQALPEAQNDESIKSEKIIICSESSAPDFAGGSYDDKPLLIQHEASTIKQMDRSKSLSKSVLTQPGEV